LDVVSWAEESFKISQDFVYKGIKENEALSDEYVSKCKEIAEKRIVTGGHRLANFLKTLDFTAFKNDEEDENKPTIMELLNASIALMMRN
jgi:hypothetical protein